MIESDRALGIQRWQQYHTINDLCYRSLELKRMVAVDGTLLAKGIKMSEDDFVQENVFDRAPDKEDYQGYMGNWGPEATHFYQDTVRRHVELSEFSLNLSAGRHPSAFHISQALASRRGQPTER